MLTTSHAYLTWRLAPGPAAPWAVAGSVAPDAIAITAGVALAARGHRGSDLLRRVYQQGPAARITTLMHSALTPSVLLAGRPGARRLAFAAGWAGHLALDYLSHHSDAWPPLFPLTRRRFPSPVSYWEARHHARLVGSIESIALAGLALSDRRRWRRHIGLAAAALAALPIAAPGLLAAHEGSLPPELDEPDVEPPAALEGEIHD